MIPADLKLKTSKASYARSQLKLHTMSNNSIIDLNTQT